METLERGFLINVFSEKNCPGLLVSILEAFEELGLEVLDARVSCSDIFQLQAVGGEVRKTISFLCSIWTNTHKEFIVHTIPYINFFIYTYIWFSCGFVYL